MTLLAPLWLAAGTLAALTAIALHFIATQRPPVALLPTARFVPAGDARAAARAARPSDLLLMLLRVAAMLLLGAAFARPVLRPRGAALVRVFVVDRSRDARADVGDSVRALWREGDALVVFDSGAREVAGTAVDSLGSASTSAGAGSLSAGFVVGRRVAAVLARGADSVELVVVSPFRPHEFDAATALLFSQWPGRVRVVRTQAVEHAPVSVTLVDTAAGSQLSAVVAALSAAAAISASTTANANVFAVRVVRDTPSSADSAAARAGSAVVHWLRAPAVVATRVEGLSTRDATLVASLARLGAESTAPPGAPATPQPTPIGARVVARWADGAPAAVEMVLGAGCIRTVGVGLPATGDVALQPSFAAVARELLAPCGGARPAGAASADSTYRSLARSGAAALAPSLLATGGNSPLAAWLVAAALLVLVAEWWVRSRSLGVVNV